MPSSAPPSAPRGALAPLGAISLDDDDMVILKLSLPIGGGSVQPNAYNSVMHEHHAFDSSSPAPVGVHPIESSTQLHAYQNIQGLGIGSGGSDAPGGAGRMHLQGAHPASPSSSRSQAPAGAAQDRDRRPANIACAASGHHAACSEQRKSPVAVKLLGEFEEKCKYGEWPASTSVHCYWCCTPFPTQPVGLPVKYRAGKFNVVGCFCSLSCACAYNFGQAGQRYSVDEGLARYSLLNALSRKLGYGQKPVRSAPDRLALSIFGGHMSIDEFRAHGNPLSADLAGTAKRIVVNYPPMQCLTQQIEDTGIDELRSEYRYIPIDNDRISKYQEKIRLARTKPLINHRNTLDHTMNLKVSRAT